MVVSFFGLTVDADWRGRLATNPSGGPGVVVPISQKVGTVLHYAGGAQNRSLGALALWQSYARYHIRANGFGAGYTGNGIMYHLGVSDDGFKAGLYDPRVMRWHAGSSRHNHSWVAINIPIGGKQDATYAQKVAIDELLHDLWSIGVGDRQAFIGHQEAAPGSTLCPGVLQDSVVHEIRRGNVFMQPTQPKIPPAADHLVVEVPGVGAFWIIRNMYRRYARVDEPLVYFGYPLSGMRGNDNDGYTQDFERARFEWVPNTWRERYDVHLARVGHELAALRYPDRYRDKREMFEPVSEHPNELHRQYFRETGHSLAYGFLAHWRDWGALEYNGYPISREFVENGKTVQYFERVRLEHHPDSTWDPVYHHVARGRVNAELLELRAEPPVEIEPQMISLDSYVHVSEPIDVTVDQMIAVCYEQGRTPAYDVETIQAIAVSVYARASEFGFRASIVWAQMCHETGYFQYGGQVRAEQYNFAGIGADNTGAAGRSFATIEDGVLAVFAHMALYVFGDTDEWPKHLQRHADRAVRRDDVARAHESVRLPDGTRLGYLGSVDRVRDYVNGRHAQSDGIPLGSLDNGYARSLVRIANAVIAHA